MSLIICREIQDLCHSVNRFMTAMRTLQKAVNKQQDDVSQQKRDFEDSKTHLQALVHSQLRPR